MTTTAKPSDVKTLGLTWELFRSQVESDADFDAYIQEVLDANREDVIFEIGETLYADATKKTDVVNIEKYLANAELLRRRAIIIKGQSVPDGPTGKEEMDMAGVQEERAKRTIARLIGSDDTLSVSVEESNHFGQPEE